ncbi:MAG: glycosyltransferase family 2 protein [Lachnospiraceae bacterium]|nr:glycosyltransferase family 2 protein [Lachnospiraceae bacterium]
MEPYKISIIVPVYNAENYLKKCVDSLVNQTYRNLEIVLVDDGSGDSSGRLCDEYAKEDSRVLAVHKQNGGLVSAWKRGVSESSGQFLCFADSDDWVDLTMIEEMAAHLTGQEREIVASDYVVERQEGGEFVWQQLSPGEYLEQDVREKVIPNLLGRERRYVTISRCMKLIGRKLVEENQKYSDPSVVMGEDMMLMLPSLIDCKRLFVMDHKAYYHYRYVRESMVHKYDMGMYENIRKLVKITKGIVEDKFAGEVKEMRLKQVDQETVFWMMLVLKNEARGNRKGYRRNILAICRSEEIRSLVRSTPVTVEETSNKLLYLVMRHPGHFTVSLLRAAMIWYYRKR